MEKLVCAVAASGLCLGAFLLFRKKTRATSFIETKSEVIFFPDRTIKAEPDQNAAYYSDILDTCKPLKRLLRHFEEAQTSVDLCLYLVTSQQLARAVLDLMDRGVRVRLIVDDASIGITGCQVGAFRAKGAFVRSKPLSYLMHHKFAIIDGLKVVNGSLNWTMQGILGNKENVIVTEDPIVVRSFVQEFDILWKEFARE